MPWVAENFVTRPLRDVLIKHLLNLCRIYSPSGYELGTIEYCAESLRSTGFEVEVSLEGNIYAKRGVTASGKYMLLNAHTDTVQRDKDITIMAHPELIQFDPFWNVVWGRGYMCAGDDRCGLAIALTLAESTQMPMKVLFTVREESGCDGVRAVPDSFYSDVAFCFSLDRRGCCDIIQTYGSRLMAPKGIVDLIIKTAAESNVHMAISSGTMADTYHIAYYVPSVNLSCGYYNAHTPYDFIRVNETYDTMMVVRNCMVKQEEFEAEWARTPENWRPKEVKYDYAQAGTTYDEGYGSGFGWGYGGYGYGNYYERKPEYNASLASYSKEWDAKSRSWVQKKIEAAKRVVTGGKREENRKKAEEEKKKPKSPADLVKADHVEEVLKDPFGGAYGDLIWAERHNVSWEELTDYPRVKITTPERKDAYERLPKNKAQAQQKLAAKYYPSARLLETEISRLREIVEYLSKQDPYIWLSTTQYSVSVSLPTHNPNPKAYFDNAVIGWLTYKATDGTLYYRPILDDATSVQEIASIYQDYPDTVYASILTLRVDVFSRVDDLDEWEEGMRRSGYMEKSFPSNIYNSLIDAVFAIDGWAVPYKIETVDGAVYEAVIRRMRGGRNDSGSVTIYTVGPDYPGVVGWTVGIREHQAYLAMGASLRTVDFLRRIYFGRGSPKFDALIERIEKDALDYFAEPPADVPYSYVQRGEEKPVAETAVLAKHPSGMVGEILEYMDMSSNHATRKAGIPFSLRDKLRLEALEVDEASSFWETMTLIGDEFEGKDKTYSNVIKFEFIPVSGTERYISETAPGNVVSEYVKIGIKKQTKTISECAIGACTDVQMSDYTCNVGSLLTLYHDIGLLLNDYEIPKKAEERLSLTLLDIEFLFEQISARWEYEAESIREAEEEMRYEGRVVPDDFGIDESTSTPESPRFGKKVRAPTDPYPYKMPFFDPNMGALMVREDELSKFADKHPDLELTDNEINIFCLGMANYAAILQQYYRAWWVEKDGSTGDEVYIVSYGISPDADILASFGVVNEDGQVSGAWSVTPTMAGVANMYFGASAFKYDSIKVDLVIRYFNGIAAFVMTRFVSGREIQFYAETGEYYLGPMKSDTAPVLEMDPDTTRVTERKPKKKRERPTKSEKKKTNKEKRKSKKKGKDEKDEYSFDQGAYGRSPP